MTRPIYTHRFDNGLVLLAEPMDWLESASFTMLLSAGCCYDPYEKPGIANFTSEMVQRGCGERDSRDFIETLENLGVEHSVSVSNGHSHFGASMVADKLLPTLDIFADLVRRPQLPADQMDEGRLVCLQEIRSLEDDLASKVLIRLRENFYSDPWGRSPHGTEQSIAAITIEDIRECVERTYQPRDAMLAVAGKFDWERLKDHVEQSFGDWKAGSAPSVTEKEPVGGYYHIPETSGQTHIGIAYPSVPYSDPNFYQARGAVGVLSDGMSSRLFTEVREKRGLCYTVFANCHSLKNSGCVLSYSSTSTDRAQETLDVMIAELQRLAEGVEQGELDRLKARIKSSLIMQQESSASRSSSIATDWYFLSRVQTIEEISRIIDELSCESINEYLRGHAPQDFTVVTLGENKLEAPVGISTS